MPYRLRIVGPDEKPTDVLIRPGETHLGRVSDSDIVLDGRGVSRQHAVVTLDGNQLSIRDLGSRYGTQVNGRPVTISTLHAGDSIRLGVFSISVVASGKDRSTKRGAAPPPVQWLTQDLPKAAQMIFPRRKSGILSAVQRLSSEIDEPRPALPSVPQLADYQALLWIARCHELLGRSSDLQQFLELVADWLLDDLEASLVVLFLGDSPHDLTTSAVRVRRNVHTGPVSISRALLTRASDERATVTMNEAPSQNALTTMLVASERSLGALYATRATPFDRQTADRATALAALVALGMERAIARDQLRKTQEGRKALERFHPPDVAQAIVQTLRPGECVLEEAHATTLAADIFGYSSMANRMTRRTLALFLNEYYDLLHDLVFANRGTLAKVWDGRALAVFGAAKVAPGDAERACQAALALRDAFRVLRASRALGERVDLRVALDSGAVLAGPIGPAERLEYTALGEPVEAALDLAARGPEGVVLATGRTLKEVAGDRFRLRTVERTYGLAEVSVYEIMAAPLG